MHLNLTMKYYNRRDFLKNSTLASAGITSLGSSGLPFFT
ncbi:MAG: twin-arginine translocation signal domain-containing protein, partial [Prolixibacteraceae bacterium]